MVSLHLPVAPLLRLAATADTVVARVLPQRGVLEWTSGVLQLVVLLLGIGALVSIVLLTLSVRRGVHRLIAVIDQVEVDLRPVLAHAAPVAEDARVVSATVRADAERLSAAASAMGARLQRAADETSQRIAEATALLDDLQAELGGAIRVLLGVLRGLRRGMGAFGTRRQRRSDTPPRDA